MSCYNNKIFVMLVIFYVTVSSIKSAPFSYENGTNDGDLNGEKLMEIGKELKLPMLQMIGKTIDNIEKEIKVKICDPHLCSDWTVWSSCTVRFGQFGSKFRTRRCSVNTTSCDIDSNSRTEKEFGICVMYISCPFGYTITKSMFCMKLYSDKERTKDAAKQQCQKDGGDLVNIDSEIKFKDVSSLLLGFKANYGIWIDGHRQDLNSPWVFTYGSQKGFFKWYPGQPNNERNALCLAIVLKPSDVKWFDYICTRHFYSLCEIVNTM